MSASQPRLIALAAAGGAGALGVIVAVVVLVRILRAPERDSVGPAASSESGRIASAGMQAPGTDELRRLGCNPAIVIDMNRLLGDAGAVRPGEPRYMVSCDVPGAQPPTCERVAGTYFAALRDGAGGNVSVRVSRPGSSAPSCAQLYAPSGALLR